MAEVKTFTSELKILHVAEELHTIDEQVNQFLKENNASKVVSVSDTATTDNTGATIGLIRVVAYEK